MPGIVGLITKRPHEWAMRQLSEMVGSLRHETFYRVGTWSDPGEGVYVGWAERQGSFADAMPLSNGRGDAVLVYSGEDFGERGIGAGSEGGGQAEASYLMEVYEEDPAFPLSLNGRFQGIVADRKRRCIKLFNDRYGLHRLYYHESPDGFYFAAEAKAILAVRPETRRFDSRGLGEFISCGCVLANRTLFEGISVLPGASCWEFRGGQLAGKETYFMSRTWEEQSADGLETYYGALRDVFSSKVGRYCGGRERVAMSLTGGLDTRMVMAWLKAEEHSMPCYTFGGMFRECKDVGVARKVAQVCGQSHQVLQIGERFLKDFGRYAARTVYMTDGCTEVGRAADLYLNEQARQIAPVRMTGNYGGEVMRQVRAFKPMPFRPSLFQPELTARFEEANETYWKLVDSHPLTFALFRQATWHHFGLLALEQTQLSIRSPYLDNDFVKVLYRAPRPEGTESAICLRLIRDASAQLSRIPTDRGLGGDSWGLISTLRHILLEIEFRAEYAYDYGMPQWLTAVDHTLSGLHLERLFLGRHKFTHFRYWYRHQLSGFVREILLDPLTLSRPYLNADEVKRIVQRHLSGSGNHTLEIHKLLSLELINRQLL